MKRYGIEADDTTQFKNASMYEQLGGDYVEYEDVEILLKELAILSNELMAQLTPHSKNRLFAGKDKEVTKDSYLIALKYAKEAK